ncbi:MAG TPA: glycosyl transferase family 28 [Bacteroidales bacterium]|jgi:hypothetical protein|nr:glycosyl transferase family 28 [Bacteroidales bacterium]
MKVFVAALDWGLGHVTRLLPVIDTLKNQNHEIVIGATKRQELLYRELFPDLKYIPIPAYAPIYSGGKSQLLTIFLFLPRFLQGIKKEQKLIRKLVDLYQLDRIISDNRYGLYHKTVESILITHQVQPQIPQVPGFLRNIFYRRLSKYINRFTKCWVPDYTQNKRLTGILSESSKQIEIPVEFIGIQSRFRLIQAERISVSPQVLVLISGPEKQRSVFEKIVHQKLFKITSRLHYLIVRGLPDGQTVFPNSINHCRPEKLKALILNAEYIICRSGYSTIMDLCYLNRKALLIPTPGQTEQEYLARHVSNIWGFNFITQQQLEVSTIERILNKSKSR